ncbi:acetylornithine deacetylase/succinyldiaminopimelate desuccinylase-like deacylase [Polyplosphaeria fusca]|uniref:Acetylornithine deacetylase/succinyldiaminopimelate desuccinylase-like deacylase n=1 Tax=Polyplosphaeria fusca TaxID=682080 RepID=A0A9P4V0A2_9PLEO|nr:acetylornithine deacetylase/succinyldiaminopimelate desuccinylase-like deacylase [Polyplosphaeria fusca]
MLSIAQELLSEIDRHRAHYVTFLQDFIRAASPNPPGDTTAAAKVIKDFLLSENVKPDIVEPLAHAPNIVADFDGGQGPGPRVVLNGHIDTFPVEKPEEWDKGPFSGHNDGESIHGRGGVDMKAGTAALVIAFTLLMKRASMMTGSVALTAVSDEETGGKWGTRYLLEHSGTPSRWAGDVVLNGEPGGLQSIRFGEKGTLRMTFVVKTPGANGAYKHVSRGANIIASKLIIKLLEIEHLRPELPDELRRYLGSEDVRKVADDIMGSGAADILLQPTVNIGTMHGGVKVNVIPEQCVFEADIRLPIGMAARVVLDRIDEILKDVPEASYEVQTAASNPANYCTYDHLLAKSITKWAEQVTGQRPVQLAGLGGTDCKFYRYAGIPAYVYGPSPQGMGAQGEKVSIDEFISLIKVHTLAVWDYLGTSQEDQAA